MPQSPCCPCPYIANLLLWFPTVAANFLCGFFSLPLHQARSVLPDDLVVLFFLVTVAAFSFFCLRSRITQRTPDLEQASVIALIALSTVSFVYFQFYHDTWSRGFHMVIFSLCGLRSISQFWQKPVLPRCVWDIVCYANSRNSRKHMAICLSATHGLTFHYILIFQCCWRIGLRSTSS